MLLFLHWLAVWCIRLFWFVWFTMRLRQLVNGVLWLSVSKCLFLFFFWNNLRCEDESRTWHNTFRFWNEYCFSLVLLYFFSIRMIRNYQAAEVRRMNSISNQIFIWFDFCAAFKWILMVFLFVRHLIATKISNTKLPFDWLISIIFCNYKLNIEFSKEKTTTTTT